jgi:hypothetical protein
MEKKFVVKNFEAQLYYSGDVYGWSKEAYLAFYFEKLEDAECFIESQNGKFQIEVVYII